MEHDARMTIVSDPFAAPAPVRPTRSSDVLVALALIAAELVLGWFTYDVAVAVSHHLDSTRPVQWFFLMLPYLPLAAVVVVRALSRRRALTSGLAALGAGAVMIAYAELIRWIFAHHSGVSYHLVETLGHGALMSAAALATLAWGLSRRRGRGWPIGLLVAAAGAWLTIRTNWPAHVGWSQFSPLDTTGIRRSELIQTISLMLPVIAACVVCWLIDRAELRRTPSAP